MKARKEKKRRTLLAVRKSLGLSMAEMAEMLGITRSQYERLENGSAVPRLDEAVSICEKLNIPIETVFADLLQCARACAESADARERSCPPGFLALKRGDIDSNLVGSTA